MNCYQEKHLQQKNKRCIGLRYHLIFHTLFMTEVRTSLLAIFCSLFCPSCSNYWTAQDINIIFYQNIKSKYPASLERNSLKNENWFSVRWYWDQYISRFIHQIIFMCHAQQYIIIANSLLPHPLSRKGKKSGKKKVVSRLQFCINKDTRNLSLTPYCLTKHSLLLYDFSFA